MHGHLQHEKESQRAIDRRNFNKMSSVYGLIASFAFGVLTTLAWKSGVWGKAQTLFRSSVTGGGKYKMVIVVRSDLGMGKGKIAAQCSHAALGCYKAAEKTTPDALKLWESVGQPKVVLKLDSEGEEGLYNLMQEARKQGIASIVIRDAGHTQVARGTATVAGLGPCECDVLDAITGHLKLL